jgi:naphthalene 1,2-dioxygenase system ferredoxin subunit
VAVQENAWQRVAGVADIAAGEILATEVSGQEIALYNVDGEFYATDLICTHGHACLTDGYLDGYVIECPLHQGTFDVRTGSGLGAPIEEDLRAYPVRVEGDDIFVATSAQ